MRKKSTFHCYSCDTPLAGACGAGDHFNEHPDHRNETQQASYEANQRMNSRERTNAPRIRNRYKSISDTAGEHSTNEQAHKAAQRSRGGKRQSARALQARRKGNQSAGCNGGKFCIKAEEWVCEQFALSFSPAEISKMYGELDVDWKGNSPKMSQSTVANIILTMPPYFDESASDDVVNAWNHKNYNLLPLFK